MKSETNFCPRCGKPVWRSPADAIHTCSPPDKTLEKSHWEGCWATRGHHDCAITHVERLRAELAGLRDSVALAYGHLWHVNNDFDAPVRQYSPKDAAYAARIALRETLSKEQRGEGINRVRAMLAAAKETGK